MAGRTYSPVIVFSFTTRTIQSDERQTSMIWARDHFPLGKFSSFKSIIVPGSMFAWCTFHLPLDCNIGRYSISHFFQNWLDITTTCFHLLRLDMSPSISSIIPPLLYLAEHGFIDWSYYSFPYSSHMRSSGSIEMPSDLFLRWIFVDSLYFDIQFACSSL